MAGPVRIAILANGSQARRELAQVEGSLGKLQASASRAAKLGVGALVLGAGAFAKSAIDAEKQFSTSMRLIQANTKASADEMAKLNALAIKLGADTSFSASEAADAMLELAKAGIDTKTIMGGGLAGTLQLAAAGGTDLATASTIASNALNTFHLAGKDMAAIAAALAGGANASTASVESLGLALQQVGPGATNAGLSLQETVAALAAFDAAGIKGSDAGTSLKTMLARLVPTSKQAATAMDQLGLDFVKGNGQFESLANIAGQLQAKLGSLSQAQRTQALTTIFGSDASRAATVLMNEGTDGLRKYIKATKDQDAAQEAAAARMDGTAGALERLSGSVETAKLRLGQELAPAVAKGADALGDNLVPAMERAIDAGKDIGTALAPAAREISEALGHLAGEGNKAGAVFNDVLLPALELTSEVVGGVVDLIDDVPGPLKEVGVQAGIAALVFPRMAAGVTTATGAVTLNIAKLKQLQAELTYTATRAQLTDTVAAKLGGTMRTVAGVGGMAALTLGAQDSNKAVSALAQAAGGAAIGFSVGGPWGAAIGGGAGLLLGLANNSHKAADATAATQEAVRNATRPWQDYASTLNQATGALQRQTREMAAQSLRDAGAFDLAQKVGLSFETIVRASLGGEAAVQKVTDRLAELNMVTGQLPVTQVDAYGRAFTTLIDTRGELSDEATSLADILKVESGVITESRDKTLLAAVATGTFRKNLDGLSQAAKNKIVTRVEAPGLVQTEADVRKLLRGIKLTPDQVKTTIKALGVGDAIRDVDRFADSIANQAPKKAKEGGKKTGKAVTDGASAGLVPGLDALRKELVSGTKGATDGAVGPAHTGGRSVGLNLGAGMYGGLNAWVGPIQAKAYQMVRGAIDSANAAGNIHSPSRETAYTGRMLGEGLNVGMDATTPVVGRGGVKLGQAAIAGILAGAGGGLSQVEDVLDRITKLVERSIKGKNDDKREKKFLKGLKDQYAQLRANGAAIDAINDKLEQQRAALEAAQQAYDDYTGSIKSSVTATGDITQFGRVEALTEKQLDDLKKVFADQPETLAKILASEGTGVSLDLLFNQLENAANDADQFALLTQKLAGMGLKQTAIDQILAAGPAAALATLEAIDTGGQGAVDKMNQLQDRLAATGDQLATNLAARFGPPLSNATYLAGVQAAQGLVNGTLVDLAKAEAAGEVLAEALLKGVKKKLKIKSPSRAFMEIGDQSMKGLDIGIDDTVASRAGARAALSLTQGFGDPLLDATATWRSMSSADRSREIKVRFTAEQVSLIQQGREIQMKLDYARSNGVTGTTF